MTTNPVAFFLFSYFFFLFLAIISGWVTPCHAAYGVTTLCQHRSIKTLNSNLGMNERGILLLDRCTFRYPATIRNVVAKMVVIKECTFQQGLHLENLHLHANISVSSSAMRTISAMSRGSGLHVDSSTFSSFKENAPSQLIISNSSVETETNALSHTSIVSAGMLLTSTLFEGPAAGLQIFNSTFRGNDYGLAMHTSSRTRVTTQRLSPDHVQYTTPTFTDNSKLAIMDSVFDGQLMGGISNHHITHGTTMSTHVGVIENATMSFANVTLLSTNGTSLQLRLDENTIVALDNSTLENAPCNVSVDASGVANDELKPLLILPASGMLHSLNTINSQVSFAVDPTSSLQHIDQQWRGLKHPEEPTHIHLHVSHQIILSHMSLDGQDFQLTSCKQGPQPQVGVLPIGEVKVGVSFTTFNNSRLTIDASDGGLNDLAEVSDIDLQDVVFANSSEFNLHGMKNTSAVPLRLNIISSSSERGLFLASTMLINQSYLDSVYFLNTSFVLSSTAP